MKTTNKLKWIMGLCLLVFMSSCKKDDTNLKTPAQHIQQSATLTIPAAIVLPANAPHGNTTVLTLYAKGVQQYKSRQKAGAPAGVLEWYLAGPIADLYDETNSIVGKHGAGPYWELFLGGKIEGQAFSPARTAPATSPNSIDWLLLKRKDGTVSTGIFQSVEYIQRIATTDGKAPAAAPANLDAVAAIPYTAIYRFSKKNN